MRADLALVGFGNVGRRFARLLDEQRDWLSLDHDLDCRIVGIATRHHGAVLRRAGLDAVGRGRTMRERRHPLVERRSAAGATASTSSRACPLATRRCASSWRRPRSTSTPDSQPSITCAAALRPAATSITANKGPAAFAYDELQLAHATTGRSFLFEGAVMDGVPVFNLVRETMPAVECWRFAASSTAPRTTS